MRLDRLQLKGITCFRDPVDLDLTQVPAGLIAIVGENGSGKTTLMEAPAGAIYGELPTRGSVAKYATEKDAYLDTTVTFDTAGTFRARRNVDGVKGIQDALLERGTERLNDGKVTTFKVAVEKYFPPLDTLLASNMAVQTRRGSFATRDKGARKDLFYALLGLHRYEAWAETARANVTLLTKRVAELSGQLEVLRATASDELHQQLQDQAYALTEDLARAEDAKTELERRLEDVDAALARLRADVEEKSAVLTARAKDEADLAACRRRVEFFDQADKELEQDASGREKGIAGRLASALAQIDRDIAALPTDALIDADLQARLARIETDLKAVTDERNARIGKNETLVAKKAEIEAAVKESRDLRTEIDTLRLRIDEYRQQRSVEIDNLTRAKDEVRTFEQLIAERDRARQTAGLLDGVPCGGTPPFDACQFLRDAATAQRRAKELNEQDLEATLESKRVSVSAIERAADNLGSKVAHAEGDISVAKRRIETLQASVELEPMLRSAEERIAGYRKDIEDAAARAAADRTDTEALAAAARTKRNEDMDRLTARRGEVQAESDLELQRERDRVAGIRAKRSEDRTANKAEIARLTAALATSADAAAQHATAAADLATKDAERRQVASDLAAADKAFALVQENVQHLRRRQDEFREAHAKRTAIETAVADLQAHLVDWQVLAQMFGREGLPTLEIDAAGPGVSDNANDLLQASFGGRFVVELVTQDVKADGKGMKEVFTLQVYDHERGGEARDLADLSGGEQVIVDSALRLAIALWVNRRNEQPIRTVWLDETTGALDPDNAQRYLAMLRRLHARAGLHHLIFVSHNPAISAQADAQIQVADGRAAIAFPPFTPVSGSQEAA